LSYVNQPAEAIGILPGMSVRSAAERVSAAQKTR
jgi:hypothetical protein